MGRSKISKTKTGFVQKISISQILLLALLLRLILLPLTYHGDIEVTYWWGKFAVDFNLRGYYDWLNFGGYGRPDQPMINIFYCRTVRILYLFLHRILWFINIKVPPFPSNLMSWFHLYGNQVLLKLPMVIADLGLIYLIFLFLKNKFSNHAAKKASLILAFYPPLVYNSALWGSGDSIINLLGLLAIFLFYQNAYFIAALLYIICILYKASLLIFVPIIITILFKNGITAKKILSTILPTLTTIYLVSRPFAVKNTFPWFVDTFFGKILPGCMFQLTSNAMNLWALLFGLKPRLDELVILPSLTARNFSIIVAASFWLIITVRLYRHYSLKNLLLSLVNITLISFSLITRMHERYTFPALIPLFLLCFYDKYFIKYFLLLTLTHLLNVYNWWWYPPINPLINLLKIDLTVRLISLINLLITFNLLYFQLKHEKKD